MRIGLDARALTKPNTGIGYYTLSLIRHLLAVDQENEYFLYSNRDYDQSQFGSYPNVRFRPGRFGIGTLWVQIVLPWLMIRDRIDVFHSTQAMAPLLGRVPTVVTVLDLIPILFPEQHDRQSNLAAKLYSLVFNRAKKLIAISDSTKNDLVKVMGIKADKIKTIYLAADRNIFRPHDDLAQIRLKYSLSKPFILSVGVISPRKNIQRLIEAYAALDRSLRRQYELVIVGKKGWQYEDIFNTIDRLALGDSVRYLGPVEPADLPLLYSSAQIFAYPSLYEGFGLPVLEAMACGTPVITSNVSSLPEVAGDAALYIDPTKTGELTRALDRLLTDNGMQTEMRAKGFAQAKMFSWERCAKETLAVYREAVGEQQ
jgi:glycosyltransferase involved in cell wall biosynthesis